MGVVSSYGTPAGPLAVAHRGGAGLAPENTVEAFARSYALGVRYLETDVRLTADGELVAFHDPDLRRVAGRRDPVGGLTLAELRRVRVLGRGPVPSLREALEAFPDARFTVDLKDRAAIAPLARLLRTTGSAHRVCVAGSWDSWLATVAALTGPDLTVAMGWRSLAATLARLKYRMMPAPRCRPGAFAHVPYRLGRLAIFHDALAERAHAIGVRVVVWTVDDAATMHRLLDAGVDGIITDRPDVLREVLVARGQWQPPAGQGASEMVSDLVS